MNISIRPMRPGPAPARFPIPGSASAMAATSMWCLFCNRSLWPAIAVGTNAAWSSGPLVLETRLCFAAPVRGQKQGGCGGECGGNRERDQKIVEMRGPAIEARDQPYPRRRADGGEAIADSEHGAAPRRRCVAGEQHGFERRHGF